MRLLFPLSCFAFPTSEPPLNIFTTANLRSGVTIYKPNLRKSCCPQYTIRYAAPSVYVGNTVSTKSLQSRCCPHSLDTLAFRSTRDQRRAVNRWTRYVLGEEYVRKVAILYPKSKEYVHISVNPTNPVPCCVKTIFDMTSTSTLLPYPLWLLVSSWDTKSIGYGLLVELTSIL